MASACAGNCACTSVSVSGQPRPPALPRRGGSAPHGDAAQASEVNGQDRGTGMGAADAPRACAADAKAWAAEGSNERMSKQGYQAAAGGRYWTNLAMGRRTETTCVSQRVAVLFSRFPPVFFVRHVESVHERRTQHNHPGGSSAACSSSRISRAGVWRPLRDIVERTRTSCPVAASIRPA